MIHARRNRWILATLFVCGQLLWSAPALAGSVKRAKTLFKRAEAKFAKGQYNQALKLYLKAYDAKPLAGFHFNIGQCYRKLDRCDKAIGHFERYIEGSRSMANRVTAEQLIGECRQELAREQQAAEATAAAPPAGTDEATAEGDQQELAPALAGVSPAGERSDGPSGTRRLRPVWFWTGVGVTSAFALMTIITGALTLKYGSDYDDPNTPPEDLPGIKDSGESLKTTANVSLGMTLASAAATTVLFFLTDFQAGGDETTLSAAPLRGGGLFALEGRF